MQGITQHMDEIMQYLRMLADHESGSRAFARFVLEHAREWESAPCGAEFAGGLPRACFSNSQNALFYDMRRGGREGLVYVEGYASSGSLSFSLPTPHAWLVDPLGRVIDPTWLDPECSAYFGVPFRAEYVRAMVDTHGPCSMIDNFHNRWELVRTPEAAAHAILDWEGWQAVCAIR
jgi:hypothetical protein